MCTLAVGLPGPFELIVLLAIVLILFGAGKLPRVLGQMGKGVKAFKEGLSGQGDDTEVAMDVTPESEAPRAIDEKSDTPDAVTSEEAEELEEASASDDEESEESSGPDDDVQSDSA
jgi:sec-independent protein translocase protein TatA